MTLVDTSVWVDHFRSGNSALVRLLEAGDVISHPFVIGELSLGGLKRRDEILNLLESLPSTMPAAHPEAMRLIDRHRLFGKGLGWVDVHLLASALIEKLSFWTLDRRLAPIARDLGI